MMRNKQIVLIVEDEIINREFLKEILKEKYSVLEAENGAVALEIILKRRYEISAVLLDVIMPVMDGYELIKRMNQNGIDDLPIIIATGVPRELSEQLALDSGAWDYITKPYDTKILLSRLRNAIARSQISTYEKMKQLMEHDELTGLHNRIKMFSNTKKMLDEHSGEQFAFIRFDIDRFSLFNTSFGEAEGNELLKFMAQCITEAANDHKFCTFGRMSADVFCACVEYDGNAEKIIKRINNIQNQIAAYRKDYLLKISVGVCIINDDIHNIDDYYFKSTNAAQRCKNRYEMNIAFYDEKAGQQIADEIEISSEMQAAIDNNQFVLYFQPKFSLSTERACGAEALVRWLHPVKGLVSPGKFIPVFEKNGFVSKLDYYVWENTCRILQSWLESGKKVFPVSVNISRISLYNPHLVDLMNGLVNKYKIPASLLQLEITESAYMTNPVLMEETITALHDAGFTILMDDFGSGYSSLNTLKRIKVDILKVDMKFLPIDDETERGEIILSCVIKMANWLGMSVVVEGVETRRQRDFLEGAGCGCVQGYYYARPIPQSEYEREYVEFYSDNTNEDNSIGTNMNMADNNTSILVIDEDSSDKKIIYEKLKKSYNVHMCDSAEEGLAFLKSNIGKIKLILVNNSLSGMTGIEFLKYCYHDKALSAIPKVIVTDNAAVEEQVDAFNNGAYDYIEKPLVYDVLLARVKHILEISRQTYIFDAVEQDYEKRSERDLLTNLLNKIAFYELSGRIIDAIPDEQEVLIVVDVDDFRRISSSHNKEQVDKILCCVADSLNDIFRRTDLVGRVGTDEFVILMTKTSSRDIVRRKAAEIIRAITFNCFNKYGLNISVSVGIAFSNGNDTIDSFFVHAEQALLEAKNTGKSKFVIYGEEVPPIADDNKPIVLVCGDEPQIYPSVALSYGDGAAFTNVKSLEELKCIFEKYTSRISVICLDMQKKNNIDTTEFYEYIISHRNEKRFSIIAMCREGCMEHIKAAAKLDISDVMTFPPQMDIIHSKLSRAILNCNEKEMN